MKKAKKPKHIAARFGDHRAHGLRDVAPGKTPITFFNEDGSVWTVVDIDERIAKAYRRLACKEREHPDVFLSRAFVTQAKRFIKERGLR